MPNMPLSMINTNKRTLLPSARHALIVLVFTLVLSWGLHLFSGTPYPAVFGRISFIGAALLLAYSVAGVVHPRSLSRSLARIAAIVRTAPFAALITAIIAERGQFIAHLSQMENLIGR